MRDAVHDQFDGFQRLLAAQRAVELMYLRGRGGEVGAGTLPIDPGKNHRAGRDEAAAGRQPAHPDIEGERGVKMHIDATKAQRHRVHAVGRAGGWTQTEPAIKQRVISLKTVERPISLVVCP